jgi:hypothetical protein
MLESDYSLPMVRTAGGYRADLLEQMLPICELGGLVFG